jgi:hypothetical protein
MSRPTPRGIAEFPGRQNSRPRIKAPFVLRSMEQPGILQMFWVWSRRGKRWTLDQVLSFDLTQNRKPGDS